MNAQARKPASKKPAAKKAVKKPVVAKKPVAKKAAPAKKTVVKKPVAKKPAAKPVAKAKATPKATPKVKAKATAKAKPVVKKPLKVVAKKAAPAKTIVKKTTPVKTKVMKPVAKSAAKPVAKVSEKKPGKEAKKVKETKMVSPAPVVHTTPIIPGYTPVVHKKNSRAAKMAALVPPPPAQVEASTAAKSSFMPMAAPAVSTIVPVIPKKDAKLANNWKTKSVDQLTDAEVIAMPDSEYMNDTQMAFFRLKLVQLKNEVLSNASETTEHLREDTVVVPDPADRATIEEEHALELRTRDRERKLLKKIEQSINRIDAGDYGYCDETGEAIGVGRLLARPTATLSLEAQERRELKQKMFGD